MKAFDLEEYLKNPGMKVVTRGGRKVRVICTDKKGDYPIVAAMYVTISIVKHRKKVSKNVSTNAIYMAKCFAKRRGNRYEQ